MQRDRIGHRMTPRACSPLACVQIMRGLNERNVATTVWNISLCLVRTLAYSRPMWTRHATLPQSLTHSCVALASKARRG